MSSLERSKGSVETARKDIAKLIELQLRTQLSIHQLADGKGPSSRGGGGGGGGDVVMLVNAKELSDRQREITREIESLITYRKSIRDFAKGLSHCGDRNIVNSLLAPCQHTEESLRILLRRAMIACKRRMERQVVREKERLLHDHAGGVAGEGSGPRRRSQRSALSMSDQVTTSLTRTRQLLADGLDRSSHTLEELVRSSNELDNVSKQHEKYGGAAKLAHNLITKVVRRDIADKVLLMFALLVFLLVVAYILKNRLLGWWF